MPELNGEIDLTCKDDACINYKTQRNQTGTEEEVSSLLAGFPMLGGADSGC